MKVRTLPQEIELKLVLSASAADAFMSSGLIAVEPITKRLHATYFDTPDQTLLNAGMSLRIRRSGRKRIQTIKGGRMQGTGLLARQEWEMPVPGDRPILDDSTPIPALLGEGCAALAPAFTVEVERSAWLVETQAGSIEVVLDRGAAVVADRRSAVCEIELELKQGEPHILFALAGKIADVIPVRLGVMTKAERGYALLGPVSTAFKAQKVDLDDEASSADACQAIVGLCLSHYRLNETLLLEEREPEALHQARVALRRLRSAIAIFAPLLDHEKVVYFQSELRWLTVLLGEARDLDVLLAKAKPGALHDRLREAGAAAYAHVEAALDSQRARKLLLDLTEWISVGQWLSAPDTRHLRDRPVRDFAGQALGTLRKRVEKRGTSLATLTDEQRHAIRKAAKRLRYGADFFASLFAGDKRQRRYRKFAASLEHVQDQLGVLNDLATAPLALQTLGLAEQAGAADLVSRRKKSRVIEKSHDALVDLVDRKNFWS